MAYEIYENTFQEKELIFIGIQNQGALLAKLLLKELKKINSIEYKVGEIGLDKKAPLKEEITLSLSKEEITKKTVILIDDVLHSGKTLAYAMKPLLNYDLKKLQVCVLINRDHKSFPVTPDYIGLSLGTTLDEHIEVVLDKLGKEYAYSI